MGIQLNSSEVVCVVSVLLAIGAWAWYRKRYKVCLGQPIPMSQAGYRPGAEVRVLQVHSAGVTVYVTLQRKNNEIIVVYFENYITDGETLLTDLKPGYYWYKVKNRLDRATGLVVSEEGLTPSHPVLDRDVDLFEMRRRRMKAPSGYDDSFED